MPTLKETDVVALLRDYADLGLARGRVGTLLTELGPGVWEVEFSDDQGRTEKTAALETRDLLVLQMSPALA